MKDRLTLALVFSLAILFAWEALFFTPQQQQHQREVAAQQQQQQAATPMVAAPTTELAPDINSAAENTIGTASPQSAIAKGGRIAIKSTRLDGSLALNGALFDDLRLLDYGEKNDKDPKDPRVTLLSPRGTPNTYYARFGWLYDGDKDKPAIGPNTPWQAEDTAPLTPEHPVALRYDNGRGLVFIRTIAMDQNYLFTVTDRVENTGTAAVNLAAQGLVARGGLENPQGLWILHEGPVGVIDEATKAVNYKDVAKEPKEFQAEKPGGWLGLTDKYWMTALLPDQADTLNVRFDDARESGKNVFRTDYVGKARTIGPQSSITLTRHLFAGAKELELLKAYQKDPGIPFLDEAIDWGWFYFLTRPIFSLLDFYYKHLVGNFGLAILLLTVTIKGVLFPLANRSFASMSKMKKLQPEMQRLRERYKDDKAKQQTELMELYKKEKVNPLAGCLPVFIQIPVFFSLYKVLYITIEMRQAPFFGWIQDLSKPDPTTIVNLFGLLPFQPPPFMHVLGVFPVLMGITMFLQTKMNPPPPDKTQEMVFLAMPVVFTFMMGNFPAGLVIYWTWNNTLSVLQQYVIQTRMGVDPEWEKKFPRFFSLIRKLKRRPVKALANDGSKQAGE